MDKAFYYQQMASSAGYAKLDRLEKPTCSNISTRQGAEWIGLGFSALGWVNQFYKVNNIFFLKLLAGA